LVETDGGAAAVREGAGFWLHTLAGPPGGLWSIRNGVRKAQKKFRTSRSLIFVGSDAAVSFSHFPIFMVQFIFLIKNHFANRNLQR
jgi:hypothetical protein